MIPFCLGLLAVGLGCYGLSVCSGGPSMILRGVIPFSIICGGLLSVLAGISSLRK